MSRRSGAFTLIEVLVVVAIIALLVAILLPSLTRAREMAKATVCLTQQHQIGIALRTYANESKGLLPIQISTWIEWLPHQTREAFQKNLGKAGNVFYCPNDDAAKLANHYWNTPTALGVYGADLHAIGYYYLGNPTWPGSPAPNTLWVDSNRNGKTEDECVLRIDQKLADQTVVLTCRVEPQGPPEDWLFKHPLDARRGASNVVFGDGHAEARPYFKVKVRWYTPRPVGW